ncbi:MAG: hypothetical protein RR795_01295 [Cetobacterium sp.]|uniref:hypothetical protein n=1 Tax=Cetobacterium sp. TaxID=2071632 RepID=UPI002FC77CF6
MLDTANIKFNTWKPFKEVITILNHRFKTNSTLTPVKVVIDLRKYHRTEYKWVHKIIAKDKGDRLGTEIQIDFSYPKFFGKDNINLVNNNDDLQKVNNAIYELSKYITLDEELDPNYFEYTRIDIAQQYEGIFEDYLGVFRLLQEILEKYTGKGTKESKEFLKSTYGFLKSYTKGFRYKKSTYCLTIYNKTAQMNPEDYIPEEEKESLIRIEQSFTPGMLGIKKLYFQDVSMKYFREKYQESAKKRICDNLQTAINEVYKELSKKVEYIVTDGKIREDLILLEGAILDEEIICNIIKNLDLDKSRRMKYYYQKMVKETLSRSGGVWRTFTGNFERIEKLIFKMCGKNITIKLNKNGVEIS